MKKNILIYTRYYIPGYKSGGPVRSISNLTSTLSKNFNFYIICLNRDHNDSTEYSKVKLNEWNKVESVNVMYVKKISYNLINSIQKNFFFHKLYFSSFFDKDFTIFPLLINKFFFRIKIIISPRGEFSLNALKIKYLKKFIYINLFRIFFYNKDIEWHATSVNDYECIKRLFNPSKDKLVHVPNIPNFSLIKKNIFPYKKVNFLKIILNGRISRIKNLKFTFNVLSKITYGNIIVHLYGTIEDSKYWNECLKIISKLPKNIKFSHMGSLNHHDLLSIMSDYDIMISATLGENFGHSIFECLNHGLPVLISNNTPWVNLEKKGIGFDFDLKNSDLFINKINYYLKMNNKDFIKARWRCIEYSNIWYKKTIASYNYNRLFN